MTFPTAESAANFAGIIAHLGYDTTYDYKQLFAAVDEYLAGSDVAPEDWRAVHSNFIHTSIDHADILQAYYGCKAKIAHVGDEGVLTISFSLYPPQ